MIFFRELYRILTTIDEDEKERMTIDHWLVSAAFAAILLAVIIFAEWVEQL